MAAAQRGDGEAYRALLSEVQVWLVGFFRRRSPPAWVDDLVQDTMLALHQHRHTFDPSLPFMPWLSTIARYKWVDHLRRRLRAAEVELTDETALAGGDPFGTLAAHAIRQLLAELPPGQALAIQTVKVEGFSIDEAARRTGQSPSLVKVNIHRGLRRLAALLEKDELP